MIIGLFLFRNPVGQPVFKAGGGEFFDSTTKIILCVFHALIIGKG